jgi:hypothetical protein
LALGLVANIIAVRTNIQQIMTPKNVNRFACSQRRGEVLAHHNLQEQQQMETEEEANGEVMSITYKKIASPKA